MRHLHKVILPLVAVAALALATPAQAFWPFAHHRHYFGGPVVYGYGYPYYSQTYYGPGYYGPGYYGGPAYYYGGSGVTFSFGGRRYYGHGHYRR